MTVKGSTGFQIAVLDLATSRQTTVSTGHTDSSPRWTPNSRSIIYASMEGGRSALKVAPMNGRVTITMKQNGDVREPAWSPLIVTPPGTAAPPRGQIDGGT